MQQLGDPVGVLVAVVQQKSNCKVASSSGSQSVGGYQVFSCMLMMKWDSFSPHPTKDLHLAVIVKREDFQEKQRTYTSQVEDHARPTRYCKLAFRPVLKYSMPVTFQFWQPCDSAVGVHFGTCLTRDRYTFGVSTLPLLARFVSRAPCFFVSALHTLEIHNGRHALPSQISPCVA